MDKLCVSIDHICERDRLMAMDCTLDGKPAHISGRLNSFATIWCAGDEWHIQAEYAWPTVARIMATDRKFFTK